jgi:hypothetical protein
MSPQRWKEAAQEAKVMAKDYGIYKKTGKFINSALMLKCEGG